MPPSSYSKRKIIRPSLLLRENKKVDKRMHPSMRTSIVKMMKLNVATPEPGPTRLASPNRNPGDSRFYFFLFSALLIFFSKVVAIRIPGPTRMANPNRSPVYFDVFIYLIKTFY